MTTKQQKAKEPIHVTREVFEEYLERETQGCDCSLYIGQGGLKYCLNSCDCPSGWGCDYHCFWNADEQNWIEWCMCTQWHKDMDAVLEKSKQLAKKRPPLPTRVLYVVSK
jgi:hypothetical protein